MFATPMQTALRGAAAAVLRTVYPPRCLSCSTLVADEFALCPDCFRGTPFIAGLACDACGGPLPGASDRAEYCDECLRTPRPWSRGRAALVYRDRARQMVMALKHGDRQDLAVPAARWMARATRPVAAAGSLVVPVPLHLIRHIKRRYNQSALLAQRLACELSLDWCPDALARREATPSLDGKTREERFALLEGRLTVPGHRTQLIAGRPVIVVDDVMTSGATLAVAAEACLAAGASSVCVSVLARVVRDA
jgi:predicted amidophosphoribosyltransferase